MLGYDAHRWWNRNTNVMESGFNIGSQRPSSVSTVAKYTSWHKMSLAIYDTDQ